MKSTILTVEDDAPIRQGICDLLKFAGYAVHEAADGECGLRAATRQEYDLLLLDLVLPKVSGIEILRQTRLVHSSVPIIILSAKGEETDRIAGLRGGADDYILKPFGPQELLARIEAVLRRSPARPQNVSRLTFPAGEADLQQSRLKYLDGSTDTLSDREADVLRYLACHRTRALSREELLTYVWHIDPRNMRTRVVDMTISRLRDKLRDDSRAPELLVTVRGKGYLLTDRVQG